MIFEGLRGREIGVLAPDAQGVFELAVTARSRPLDPEIARAIDRGDVISLLRTGDTGLRSIQALLAEAPIIGIPDLRLHAPIARPPKILGVGGNFAGIFGGWNRTPEVPPIFWKSPTSIIGPEEEIVLPEGAQVIQPEPELVVVLGREGRRIPADERAFDYVAGYTLGNDISNIDRLANDVVFRKRPDLASYGFPTEVPFNLGMMFSCKSWDTFSPLGPWLVTKDELDIKNVRIDFRVNGALVISWKVGEMTFGIPDILAYISSICTLEPGDVVFTGTPQLIPPLRPGDVLEHSGTGMGVLRVHCVAERPT